MRLAAVIPARMASSRLPGKPLLSIKGLPMIEHVRRRAVLSGHFDDVVVATCDREIADVVERAGGTVMMTSPSHPGATDRVAEAMDRLDCTHVVNIQGDELLITLEDLQAVARAVRAHPDELAWNAAAPLDAPEELADLSTVKLVVSRHNRVLLCIRDATTMPVRAPSFAPLLKSIGVMAYEREFLRKYLELPRTPIEIAEGTDQNRIVEHDLTLRVVELRQGFPSINVQRDVTLVEECFDKSEAQRSLLQQTLELSRA